MNYRLTILTPTLVGDGERLSPIDYMVWKDQVNVLDQRRIFKLLAKGPRLDGYLQQLSRAEKLDFASWGGFAQNYADRRIPFESFAVTPVWNRTRADQCFIPTFCTGVQGHYLPASALKGALRTAALHASWKSKQNIHERAAAQIREGRVPRRLAVSLEGNTLGTAGADRMRGILTADSKPVAASQFKVYLLRTSTVVPKGNAVYELGWKLSGRGAVDPRRTEESAPAFAEMAIPGTVFEGAWQEPGFFREEPVRQSLHWRHPMSFGALAADANAWALASLDLHQQYAERLGLKKVADETARLRTKAEEAGDRACVVCLGWGSGLFGKSATLDTQSEGALKLLKALPYYERAIQSGLPFPKTRRVVFQDNQPATLPGWALLEVE